jgi:hypothetical protein
MAVWRIKMTKSGAPSSVTVYVLEIVTSSYSGSNFSLETVGVYSSENEAIKAIQSLPPETDQMVYNVQSFIVNASALDVFEDHSKEVKELMDRGVIDQLVGEDGNFYYILTEFGKEITKQTPDDII